MRSLVTGGAGLIGSHLVEALLAGGDEVTVLDDLSTGRWEHLAAVADAPGLRRVEGTILDGALVRALAEDCDEVFHLAAAVGVGLAVARPAHTIETNVLGTREVLAAAAARRLPVLVASSSEVYGRSERLPFREDDDMVLGPTAVARWGYACSKAVDEFMALAYAREHALPVVVARLFNTVGPRQTDQHGMVVPRLVRQCLRGEPMTVHGDGRQSRCFADAADVAPLLLRLLRHPQARGGTFNVGHDEAHTILALAERVRARVDPRAEIALVPYASAYGAGFEDPQRRAPDLSRLRALLGPLSLRGLDAVLDRVIAYERSRLGGGAP